MQQCTDEKGVVDSKYGGNEVRLRQCSLIYYASLAIGIHPDEVHCPLAGAYGLGFGHAQPGSGLNDRVRFWFSSPKYPVL